MTSGAQIAQNICLDQRKGIRITRRFLLLTNLYAGYLFLEQDQMQFCAGIVLCKANVFFSFLQGQITWETNAV